MRDEPFITYTLFLTRGTDRAFPFVQVFYLDDLKIEIGGNDFYLYDFMKITLEERVFPSQADCRENLTRNLEFDKRATADDLHDRGRTRAGGRCHLHMRARE